MYIYKYKAANRSARYFVFLLVLDVEAMFGIQVFENLDLLRHNFWGESVPLDSGEPRLVPGQHDSSAASAIWASVLPLLSWHYELCSAFICIQVEAQKFIIAHLFQLSWRPIKL